MSFLLCGSDGSANRDIIPGLRHKDNTLQCFGLRLLSNQMKYMESFTLSIKRGENGFGFIVTGSNPAKIKVVKPDSAAQLAGLRKGDGVMRIDGENVSGFLAESVAKIVRDAKTQIVLDIERECKGQPPSQGQDQGHTTNSPAVLLSNEALIFTKIEQNSTESNNRNSRLWRNDFSVTSFRVNYQELSEQEKSRQVAIQDVVNSEKIFLAQMHFGSQSYSTPLRHNMISPAEHSTLFQNVQKLVAISEYHVYKLEESGVGYSDLQDTGDKFVDTIGSIYLPKVFMMAEVFEQYCNGIKNAFRLLAELKKFEEFEQFLQNITLSNGQATITDFLQKPLQHITSLVLGLQKVLSRTPVDHQDMGNISQVVENLKETCNRINENNTRRSQSMTSLVSRSFDGQSSRSSSRNSSSSSLQSSRSSDGAMSLSGSVSSLDSSQNSVDSSRKSLGSSKGSGDSSRHSMISTRSSIESCVDPEVIDLQRRLVFSEEFPAFQLATATRHLIYTGELTHVDGDQLYVVLLSDLLLLTRLAEDERLLVVDYPLLLQDVVAIDFGNAESLELTLTVESEVDEEWVEDCDVILAAPSVEQKYTWKNLIERRIKSTKTQQDFLKLENFI